MAPDTPGVVRPEYSLDARLENARLLEEWLRWMEAHHYASTTVSVYKYCVRMFLADYPQVPIEKLTAEHVERHLDRGLARSSYNSRVEVLRAFFNWARRVKRLIRTNPCAGVDKPPIHRPMPPVVLPDQFAALCRIAKRLEQLAILHLLYYSGLRINELCHLKVGDLDLERRLLRVRLGKGTHRSGPRERTTVIHKDTLRVLKLYMWRSVRLHPDVYLFGKSGRRPAADDGIRRWFKQLRSNAGLPADITPHALRHGFAKLGKLHTLPLEIVAAFMGHENLETTRRVYGALTAEEMRSIYDRALGGDEPRAEAISVVKGGDR